MTDFLHDKMRRTINGYEVDVCGTVGAFPHTLILIHGIGVSGRYFYRFAQQASAQFNVVILDLPGYGSTPKPAGGALTISEFASIVIQFTESLDGGSINLLGHSMGSQIVAHAARRRPDLFNAIVLSGPTTYDRERTLFMQGIRLAQDTLKEPWAANRIIFTDYARMGLLRYLRTAQYMVNDHLEETLSACNVRQLIVRGEKDVIAPSHWVSALADLHPSTVVKQINGAPHVVHYTNPKELLALCNDFLLT